MYTGYFAKLKYYEEQGLIPIAICGGIPNWYSGLWYKKLAPKWAFFNEWKNGTEHKGDNEYYIQHFNEEVLKNKNPSEIEKELKTLAKRRTSDKIILLCKGSEVLWAVGVGLSEKLRSKSQPTHRLKMEKM